MASPNMQVTASALSKAIQVDQAKPGLLGSTISKVWNAKGVHKVPADPVTGFLQQGFSAAKARLGYGEGRTLTEREASIADISRHLSQKEQDAIFDNIGPFLDSPDNKDMLSKMVAQDSAYRPLLIQLGAHESDLDALAQVVDSESAPLASLERPVRARATKALTLLTFSISALRAGLAKSQPLDEGMHWILTSEDCDEPTFTITEEMMKDEGQVAALLKKLSGNANFNQELANVLAESIRPQALEFFFPSDGANTERNARIHRVMAVFADMVNYSLYSDHRESLIKAGVAEEQANLQADKMYPELKESDNVVEYLLQRGLALPSIATRLAVLCAIHPEFDPVKVTVGKRNIPLPSKLFSEMRDAGLEPVCDLCMPLTKRSYVTPMRDYFVSAMHEYNTLEKHFPSVKALIGEKADVYAARAVLGGSLGRDELDIDVFAANYLKLCQEGSKKEQLQAVMSNRGSSKSDKQDALMMAVENRSDLTTLNMALLVSERMYADQADPRAYACRDLHAALGMMSGVETRRALRSSNETFHVDTDDNQGVDDNQGMDDIHDGTQSDTASEQVSETPHRVRVINLSEENDMLKKRLEAEAQEKRQIQQEMAAQIEQLQAQLSSHQQPSAKTPQRPGKRGRDEGTSGKKEPEVVEAKRQKRVTRSRAQLQS